MSNKNIYQQLGASADKAGLHMALSAAGLTPEEDTFCTVLPDIAGDPDYYFFSHSDGAGTKSIVAYLLEQESGDSSIYASLAQDALVMNLDDVFCIGRPENLYLANTIGRNAHIVGDLAVSAIIGRYKLLCEVLAQEGISLTLTGGETADCGDVVRTLLVDATLSGRIKRRGLISTKAIQEDDIIIGLSSTGQSRLEQKPNSGIGSNGLTLARHTLLTHSYLDRFPEAGSHSIRGGLSYPGRFNLSDTPEGLGMSIGEALLSPTRTYSPLLAKIYCDVGKNIHGVIHCTGGGQTKVLRFGKGLRYIKDNLFKCPPLFSLIQREGDVDWREMFKVFNMGHRLEIYVPQEFETHIIDLAKDFGIEGRRIGVVQKLSGLDSKNQVVIDSEQGTFDYMLS